MEPLKNLFLKRPLGSWNSSGSGGSGAAAEVGQRGPLKAAAYANPVWTALFDEPSGQDELALRKGDRVEVLSWTQLSQAMRAGGRARWVARWASFRPTMFLGAVVRPLRDGQLPGAAAGGGDWHWWLRQGLPGHWRGELVAVKAARQTLTKTSV